MKKTLLVLCVSLLFVCFAQADKRVEQHRRCEPRPRPEARHQSGIIGQVVWATWSPDLETPVQCLVSVETDSGRLITTLETDADGLFRVVLKPGTYVLTPYFPQDSDATLSGPSLRVTVEKKGYAVVVMPFAFFDDQG
jgi:hypothetical protein